MARGHKTGGRKKGTPNRTTQALKDAILDAAAIVGEDGQGKEGVCGYLTMIARTDSKTFAGLLGRVVPLQVGGDPDNPLQAIHRIERIIVRPKDTDG